MNTETYRLPICWASYLINGDASGISEDDAIAADQFLARMDLDWPVSMSDDYYFCKYHDAMEEMPFAADCSDYTFFVRGRK